MQKNAVHKFTTKILSMVFLLSVVTVLPAAAADANSAVSYELHSERLASHFQVVNGGLRVTEIEDRSSGAKFKPSEAFSLLLRDGRVLAASQFQVKGDPHEQAIEAEPTASRASEQVAGRKLCADLSAPDGSLTVHWCAVLRKGANYLRQEITLKAEANPVDIAEVRLFDFKDSGAQVVGTVPGSPLVVGNFFFGFEFPLAVSTVKDSQVTATLLRELPLGAGQSISYSSVVGVAAPGQLRRDFLAYLEEERAHPYRTFLHYNTWYDISYVGHTMTEAQGLDRVHAFGEELTHKRGVTMDSALFDDGWDDHRSIWQFNSGFPNGFTNIRKEASQYGFNIGVWMSPWGGYEKSKKQRIAAGKKAGLETMKNGFALSAPHYYELFEKTCLEMISKYGVNQFKFDGTGNANHVFPGSIFDSDFSAMIHLIGKLRLQEPNIFINLTTGTKPSPFWLRYTDSVWHGATEDHAYAGVGSWRQKWITYRDEQTYRNIVEGGPLFPLNSLMHHGLIYATYADHLSKDPEHDFPAEIHSYFGSGTQLQEMYITPALLSKEDWDVLAESARWSRTNASVLKDTHWIGGDPGNLAVYGWASWSPKKGIVVLRNPSNLPQEFLLDVGKAFELPTGAPQGYEAHSPWAADAASASIHLHAGQVQHIQLQPFQVLTLDARPAN